MATEGRHRGDKRSRHFTAPLTCFRGRNSRSLTEPYLNINNARFQVGSEVFHPGATECAQSITAA